MIETVFEFVFGPGPAVAALVGFTFTAALANSPTTEPREHTA